MLLHGFPNRASWWEPLTSFWLTKQLPFRAVACDLRGYSPQASPDGPEHYTYDILATDVLSLADAVGWNSFHLAGHDHGSGLGWFVAAKAPSGRVLSYAALSVPHLDALSRGLYGPMQDEAQVPVLGPRSRPGSESTLLLATPMSSSCNLFSSLSPLLSSRHSSLPWEQALYWLVHSGLRVPADSSLPSTFACLPLLVSTVLHRLLSASVYWVDCHHYSIGLSASTYWVVTDSVCGSGYSHGSPATIDCSTQFNAPHSTTRSPLRTNTTTPSHPALVTVLHLNSMSALLLLTSRRVGRW